MPKVSFKHIVPKSKLINTAKRKKKAVTSNHHHHNNNNNNNNAVASDDDLKIETISLEEFISPKQSTELNKALRNISDKDIHKCFTECVKLVYSPICSQLVPEKEILNLEQYAYIGIQLTNTIRNIFPSISHEFESVWNKIAARSFPKEKTKAIDYALLHLHLRKELIEYASSSNKDKNDVICKHFSPNNFRNETEYRQWKKNECKMIDVLIEKLKRNRVNAFLFRISFDSFQLKMCENQNSLQKNQQVYFKIRLSAQENEKPVLISSETCVKWDKKSQTIKADLNTDLPMIESTREDQDIIIQIYKKGVLGSGRFGRVTISTSSLLPYFVPNNCSWAIQPFSAEYPIYESLKGKTDSSEKKIGQLFVSFNMQMCKSSNVEEMMLDKKKMRKKALQTDYYMLFDVLIHHLIHSNNPREKGGTKLFNFYEVWLIEEFANQHGISEVYKRLSIIREMAQKSELLLVYFDEFRESVDFVHSNLKGKFLTTTLHEMELLNTIKRELVEKLETVIVRLLSELESRTNKRRLIKLVIELLEYVSTSDETMTKSDFNNHLKGIITKAMRMRYMSIKYKISEELSTFKDSDVLTLITLVDEIRESIYEIFYYSMCFSKSCQWEINALKIYVDELNNDFYYLRNQNRFTGYHMLKYCSRLQQLNDEILDNFSRKELKEGNITLLRVNSLIDEYENIYVSELKATLVTHMNRAISLDKWERINDQVLHSASVVDIFTSAFQTLEFISNLEFVREKLLDKFSVVVGECIVTYAKILQETCTREIVAHSEAIEEQRQADNATIMHNNTAAQQAKKNNFLKLKLNTLHKKKEEQRVVPGEIVYVTTEFIVKLNNIEASRTQFRDWVKALMEAKSSFREVDLSYLENEDDEYSDDSTLGEENNHTASSNDSDEDDDNNKRTGNNSLASSNSASVASKSRDPSIRDMRGIMNSLSIILHDLEILVASQFRPYIKECFSNILTHMRKLMKRSLDNEENDIQKYGVMAAKMLKDNFLEAILTPNLAILSENIYEQSFLSILAQIFSLILNDCTQLLIPFSSFIRKKENILDKGQIRILKHLISTCEDYFYGNGEGLSKNDISRKKRFIAQLFQLFEMDTPRLISLYNKVNGSNVMNNGDRRRGGNKANEQGSKNHEISWPIKGYHILGVLSTRSDGIANKFFNEHLNEALSLYLVQEFSLSDIVSDGNHHHNYNSNSGSSSGSSSSSSKSYTLPSPSNCKLLMSKTCVNSLLKKGKYYLTDDYLLWAPKVSLISRRDGHFRKKRTAVDSYTGKFKIFLGDIQQIEKLSTLTRKGIKIYARGIYPQSLCFYKKRRREKLLAALTQQCEKHGVKITVQKRNKRGRINSAMTPKKLGV